MLPPLRSTGALLLAAHASLLLSVFISARRVTSYLYPCASASAAASAAPVPVATAPVCTSVEYILRGAELRQRCSLQLSAIISAGCVITLIELNFLQSFPKFLDALALMFVFDVRYSTPLSIKHVAALQHSSSVPAP